MMKLATLKIVRCVMVANLVFWSALAKAETLAHWRDGDTRKTIVTFVEDVTKEGSENFLPVEDRIAVFDNDGTLWTEYPAYNEVFFLLSQLKALAPDHPEWKSQEPFASILNEGPAALNRIGLMGAFDALAGVYSSLTLPAIAEQSRAFLDSEHPVRKMPFAKTTYLPMVELIAYLQRYQFKVYIVSGGTLAFMRELVLDAYSIPREQVIGSRLVMTAEENDGAISLGYESKFESINNGIQKVVNIQQIIGKRPVIAVGNSNGDLEMLSYTTGVEGVQLGMLVHHDDAVREGSGGYEERIHTIARQNPEWHLISIKDDFRIVFSGDIE